MKKDIHPTYYKDAEIKCACGNVIVTGSTLKELKTDICSACHPFYTGKQKLIDSAGRVDKFMAKQKAAVDRAEQIKQAALDKKSGKKGEKYMTIDEIKAMKEKPAIKEEKVEKTEKVQEPVVKETVEEAQAVQGEMFFEERKVEKTEESKPAPKAAVKKAAAPKKEAVAKKAPAAKKPAVKKAPAKKTAAKSAKKPAKKASK